jgi:hypothetical protein
MPAIVHPSRCTPSQVCGDYAILSQSHVINLHTSSFSVAGFCLCFIAMNWIILFEFWP